MFVGWNFGFHLPWNDRTALNRVQLGLFTLMSSLHTGRNCFNLFQISFSANTADAHPGVSGVSKDQKYSLPGRPSSQNGVKSKTICHFLRNFDEFLNGFWFYSILAGWSTCQWVFLTKFLVMWNPWHPWVCIRSDLKPLETDISDSSYCALGSPFDFLIQILKRNNPKRMCFIQSENCPGPHNYCHFSSKIKGKVLLETWIYCILDPI